MNHSFGETVRRLNPHLFGPSDKPVGAGSLHERDLHDEIFDYCRARGWIAFHGSMAERTHRTEGEPDFIILADRGRVFFVECKSRTGKRSPAQNAIAAHAARLGIAVHVVRTIDEFRAITSV